MANDGTVKIGTELDDSGFKSGLLGGDIESVDVNDIISARFDIVEVYEKPARKKGLQPWRKKQEKFSTVLKLKGCWLSMA